MAGHGLELKAMIRYSEISLLVSARDTAVPSSPKTCPQLTEMNDSVLEGIPRADIPSELRLGM